MEEGTRALSASGRELPKRWFAIIVTIWAGQAVSMVTSYAAGYAAIWYVTETTESAIMLAAMSICAFLPQGILSPFGGVIADKYNRKTVMIIADMGTGIVSLILGIVILIGQASLPVIFIMVIVRSIGGAFHGPAMMAAMPMLVPQKHLLRINTLDQLLISFASIGSPAFGIFLYTVFGFHTVMFLDFFGALIAVLGLALAKIPTSHDETTEGQNVFENMRDGWRELSSTRGLVILILGLTAGMMVFGPLSALFPLMTYSHFGGDGYMASIVEAAWGVGMIIGSGILMAWGGGKRLAGLIAVAAVIVGATTAACGFLTPEMFIGFVILCVVMAVAASWFNGPMITLVQRNVPEEKLGRALGITTAAMGLATPIGIGIGGVIADVIGIAPFFIYDGLICVVLGIALYLPRSVRALDKAPQNPIEVDASALGTQAAQPTDPPASASSDHS